MPAAELKARRAAAGVVRHPRGGGALTLLACGIIVVLVTDTFPEDLIANMRIAGLLCRFADESFRVGSPYEVFAWATLGGARALGRDDSDRLAPGAKVDLLVVDLQE